MPNQLNNRFNIIVRSTVVLFFLLIIGLSRCLFAVELKPVIGIVNVNGAEYSYHSVYVDSSNSRSAILVFPFKKEITVRFKGDAGANLIVYNGKSYKALEGMVLFFPSESALPVVLDRDFPRHPKYDPRNLSDLITDCLKQGFLFPLRE